MIRTDLVAPIGQLLERQAESRADALAFRDSRRSVNYGDLGDRTARFACHLQNLGVERGERVGIFLPNSVDWVEACIGIVRADAVAVPISCEATDEEIVYRLSDAQCVAVVARPDKIERLRGICANADVSPRLIVPDDAKDELVRTESPRDPTDIEKAAFIVYTSGTTGKAKGVLLSLQGMLWVTAACWAPIAGLNADDYVLNSLPLYHSYSLNLGVVSIIATGASEYLMDHFSTSQMATLLSEQPFTVLPGVPTVFHYMLEKAREQDRHSLSAVRICVSAGAVLQGTLNEEFERWFGVKLLDGYGITETSTMVTINTPEGGRPMGSCGLPLPGLTTRIVDAEDRDQAVGAEGELIVRGPNVMLGYHGKADATEAALADGWYRTGDLARRDRFGFLAITGRLKEVIIRGGQNIAPAEVEEVVSTFPAVLDCAVVGIAHEFLGEVPVVAVIARPGHQIDADAIIAHSRQHLSSYKVPVAVYVVPDIPRTGSGKVQRFLLKEALEQR